VNPNQCSRYADLRCCTEPGTLFNLPYVRFEYLRVYDGLDITDGTPYGGYYSVKVNAGNT